MRKKPPLDRDGEILSATVTPEQAGQRLDRTLATALDGLSRSRVKALIEGGRVSLDGATITEPSYRVKPAQSYTVALPPPAPAVPAAQPLPLAILYEDRDVIVVDKPAGLVVHPAPGNPDRTLVNALIAHCGDELTGIGGVARPGIVHRLDKETSGLMVAAKSARAHASLTEQFARRTIDRAYLAVVWGVPVPPRGEVRGNIGRNPRNRKKMAVLTRGGKPALTRYDVKARLGCRGTPLASLLECRLATGRTHQVRVHLAALGHPLIGDPLYGRSHPSGKQRLPEDLRMAIQAFRRQALHACELGFDHPATGTRLKFSAPLPSDIHALVNSFESF
ncbi:MAG: RluA family pseudouridine synthase [Alphaproteobacteria bacterium]